MDGYHSWSAHASASLSAFTSIFTLLSSDSVLASCAKSPILNVFHLCCSRHGSREAEAPAWCEAVAHLEHVLSISTAEVGVVQ